MATVQAFNPKGKTFNQQIDAFIADVKKTHQLTIGKDSGRTKEWQQKHHVAHMFLYNAYKSTKPVNTDKGKRTIAWSHLSDASVNWASTKFDDFLRTSKNTKPIKSAGKWKVGQEPDETKTIANVKLLLKKAGIGNGGKAMVSSGLKPCGEPCKCKAGRSKHLNNLAADLNSAHLKSLKVKLNTAKAGSIDEYLKKFGLHRPLLNHPTSPEKWHVEAL